MRNWLYWKVCIAVLIISMAGIIPVHAQMFEMESALMGKTAPDFTLQTLGGGPESLAKAREGKSAILFFWATWCPHCRNALGNLVHKKSEIEQKGIKVLLVDVGEEDSAVQAYVQRNKVDFKVFLDKNESLSDSYAIIGVPTFFFLDKDGIIRAVTHTLPSDYEKILQPSK